jgi:hypothetical protein
MVDRSALLKFIGSPGRLVINRFGFDQGCLE